MKTHDIRFLLIAFMVGIVVWSCNEEKIDPDKYVLPLQIQSSRVNDQIKLKWYSPLAHYTYSANIYLPNAVSADSYELFVSKEDTLNFKKIDEIDFSSFEYFYPENIAGDNYFFRIKSSAKGAYPTFSNTVWLMGGTNTEWDMLLDAGDDNTLNMGDISPDGSTIIFSKNEGELCCDNIYSYSLDIPLNNQEILVKGKHASFSKDGNLLSFVSHFGITTTPQPTNLGVFSLSDSEILQITTGDHVVQFPVWSDEGDGIYYLDVGDFYSSPWLLQNYNIASDKIETLVSADELMITNRPISFDASGKKVFFTAYENTNEEGIYAYDLDQETVLLVEQTFWGEYGPSISPNGNFLAFISDRSGKEEIWIKNLESGKYYQLTADFESYPQGKLAWSNDNSSIYFKGYYQDSNGIFKVNVQP